MHCVFTHSCNRSARENRWTGVAHDYYARASTTSIEARAAIKATAATATAKAIGSVGSNAGSGSSNAGITTRLAATARSSRGSCLWEEVGSASTATTSIYYRCTGDIASHS